MIKAHMIFFFGWNNSGNMIEEPNSSCIWVFDWECYKGDVKVSQ